MLKQLQRKKAFSINKDTNNVSTSSVYKMLGEPAPVVQNKNKNKKRWNKTEKNA